MTKVIFEYVTFDFFKGIYVCWFGNMKYTSISSQCYDDVSEE